MDNKRCEQCGARCGQPCYVCGKVLCIVCYALPGHLLKEQGLESAANTKGGGDPAKWPQRVREEAIRKVAQVAMGDLLGASEPPEGIADNYPFNACAWRDSLPEERQADAEQAIRYVYQNEQLPNR